MRESIEAVRRIVPRDDPDDVIRVDSVPGVRGSRYSDVRIGIGWGTRRRYAFLTLREARRLAAVLLAKCETIEGYDG